jgi:hypothetical protein
MPPSLAISLIGGQSIVSWPTSASSYTLEATTNLATGIWSNITAGIATSGNNFVYTNLWSASAVFFRLQQ